jgi:hypothetical protein
VILIVPQIVCQAHLCDGLHVGHVIALEKCFPLSRACSHLQYFSKVRVIDNKCHGEFLKKIIMLQLCGIRGEYAEE